MLGTGMHPYRLIPNDKMKPTAVSKFFQPTNNQVSGERNFAGGNVNEEGPQGEVQGDGGAHARREADARYPVDLAQTMVVGDVGEGAGSGGNLFGSREISERTEVIIRDPGEDVYGVHNYAGGGATKMSADEGAGARSTPLPQPTLTPMLSADNNRATKYFATSSDIKPTRSLVTASSESKQEQMLKKKTGVRARRSLFSSGASMRQTEIAKKRRVWGSKTNGKVVAE
jgi:hypothetical protein